ncbi:MAG: hypothetical protein R3D98_13830 [Candidatus Krumholzibacteriia bacterium]
MSVVPADWPLASLLVGAAETALERLEPPLELAECELVADALAADDRTWLRLREGPVGWRLRLWLHPDQVLTDRPGHGHLAVIGSEWRLGPIPGAETPPAEAEFSLPNAQRFLYQQFMLAGDVIAGRLIPAEVPPSLVEAFQEAWLIGIDGRLQRLGLPHLSAGERRAGFLRLFAPAGVVTPGHWAIFNALWDGTLSTQGDVLAKVRLLPALVRQRGA